jgi:protocatechuate 3,4-dioxygenase beta subunit
MSVGSSSTKNMPRRNLASGCSDVKEAGSSIFDKPFEVTDMAPGEVDIVIDVNALSLKGTIVDGNHHGVAGAVVILVPQEGRKQVQSQYQVSISDDTGHYSFSRLAPGSYKIFAWDTPPQSGGYFRSETFISKYEDRARAVIVRYRIAEDVTVEVIRVPR